MKKDKTDKKKRGVFGFLFRFVYKSVILLLALLILMSVAVFIIFKIDKFRQPVVQYVVKQANEFLLADVSLRDFHIHKLNYVQLKDLLITVRQDTMLYARRVNLNFNPLSFKSKKFRITRVKFEDAYVNLERYRSDSLWNYNLIAPPGDSDKPPGEMPELTLDVDDIQFVRSVFIYRDSVNSIRINSDPDYQRMDYSDFEINDLNLDIDAKLILDENIYKINIQELNFKERYSGFQLVNLKTDALLDEQGISLSNLYLQTPNSKIDIDANLPKLSIFKPVDISKVDFDIDFKAEPFDAADVEYFASTGMKINSADKINIKTKGKLNNLTIRNIEIEQNSTNLSLNGTLRNILDMENFNYSVLITDSKVKRSDVISILPELKNAIPDINDVKINSLEAKGYLDSVYTDFDIITDAGDAKGYASVMYIDGMKYAAEIKAKNINLAKITGSQDFASSITGDIKIKGSGISPENIKANVYADISDSEIAGYNISKLILNAYSSDNDIINLDSLYVEIPRSPDDSYSDNELFNEAKSYIMASGMLDRNKKIPDYSLDIEYSALNLAEVLSNSNMPEHMSGEMQLNSKGLTPDELDGYLHFNFNEILFSDRVLLPFDMNLQVNNTDSLRKEIMLSSDFFDVSLNGTYRFEDLVENLNLQSLLINNYIKMQNDKMFIAGNEDEQEEKYELTDKKFRKMDVELTAEIKRISPLMAFVDNIDIYFTGDFKIKFDADTAKSVIDIGKMNIDNINISNNGFSLDAYNHLFSGEITFEKTDSILQLAETNFNLVKSSKIMINGNKFDSTMIGLSQNYNKLSWKFGSSFNDEMYAEINGNLDFQDDNIISRIDKFEFDYFDLITLKNDGIINMSYGDNTLSIKEFKLAVDSLNELDIAGSIRLFEKVGNSGDSIRSKLIFNNFVLSAGYENLQKFISYLSDDLQNKLSTLNADLTEFEIMLNGNISDINMQLNSKISDIKLQGYELGSLSTVALLSDYTFELNSNMKGKNEIEYLRASIKSLGLNSESYAIDSLSKIIAEISMNDLPLPLVSPFVPVLNNITGKASANIDITGFAANPDINGNLNLSNTSFILESNNIKYMAEGDVKFTMDEIETTNLILKNTKRDSEKGVANVNAKIILKNLAPDYFDISVDAQNFQILSNASQDPMPNLYGDLIISTGSSPLSFRGSMDDPTLAGDVNVISADLKMPEFTQQQETKTQLRYQIIGEKVQHQIKNSKDSLIRLEEKEPSDIMKVMDFNMRVKLLGQVSVLIDLGTLGEIYANVGMQNRDEAIIYQKNTERNTENLTGQIVLEDNSTFKSFKVLQTSGEISFPTGQIDNPHLNLEASYKGTTMIDNQPKQYTVIMYITGSQEQPQVKFTYQIDGQEAVGDPKQIEEDAILLLVAGRTKSSSGQGASSPDMLQQSLNSGISNYGSQLLTDFLMKTGSIQSVDLDFKGDGFEEATVKFTGQTELFGGNVNWTIGGALSDFSGNNEIILDVPLTNYTDNEFWRNFIFQFTRASHTNTTIQDQNSKNWEIKFKVGGSF